MTDFVDAYDVLGVAHSASQAELKAAHRRLVRRHHPDLVPPAARAEATRRVQEINVAYGLVREPGARREYDLLRRAVLAGRAGAGRAHATRRQEWDAGLAGRWEAAVTTAGRWAGWWWKRNRAGIARRAAGWAGRTGRDALGRVLWLLTSVSWAVAGLVLAVAAQRLLGVAGALAPATGAVAGALVGSQRGWQRRLRLAGLEPSGTTARLATAIGGGALLLALVVDWRL